MSIHWQALFMLVLVLLPVRNECQILSLNNIIYINNVYNLFK
ncbi:hypothetical protein SAMN04487894_11772 [Niabella drilacis]|uniref:Uncharacterized protein n=1 Tax=Niabella drilacis (strain DSM 25811 / CCM 8410 / CCUG 62505 / LMG 26954 / E90) TaxID=1285928 RepID=A0A1G6Z7A7_NIADE|nr:hypothetical protein SAMN04487894_11772 [Niabella drilacis]